MEVAGKIKWLDETKTYGSKGFRKREIVVTTEEQYPQHILVEFVQDKCDLLNSFQLGQSVKIGINRICLVQIPLRYVAGIVPLW